jgi:5-methyltetrahydropteroyltriglutamate--homocysteine methyltransferase
LIDRERLRERLSPRVRARDLWRIPERFLEDAEDDATRLAVQDMERAGVGVVTDGEMRRESCAPRAAPRSRSPSMEGRPGPDTGRYSSTS